MKHKIITTADGSKTIQIEEWNEQYHSVHGAIQEANHVFIKHGFLFCYQNTHQKSPISNKDENKKFNILEIGLGTGLNAFLTFLNAEQLNLSIHYEGVEKYPVALEEIKQLNYIEQLSAENHQKVFDSIHQSPWESLNSLTSSFDLTKQQKDLRDIDEVNFFDLIYFDAFGARVQPDLWSEAVFQIMYNALKPKGVLVTYSAKGSVRRAMQSVGFLVEKLPGPPGKREMLRARKGS